MSKLNCLCVCLFAVPVLSFLSAVCFAGDDAAALREEFAANLISGQIPLVEAVSSARAIDTKDRQQQQGTPGGGGGMAARRLREREGILEESRETYQTILDNNVYLLGPNLWMTRNQVVQAITSNLFTGQITAQQAVEAAQRYENLRQIQENTIREELANVESQLVSVRQQMRDEEAAQERLREQERRYEQSIRERMEREAGQRLRQEQDRRRADVERERRETAARQQREEELRRLRAEQERWVNEGGGSGGGGGGRDVREPGLGDLGSDLSDIFGGR